MIKFLEKLLSIIYVKQCLICKSTKQDKFLCDICHKKIHFMPPAVLKEILGCKVYACTIYDDIIKQIILNLKYKGQKNLAIIHAQIMFEYFKELNLEHNFLILSVPIHKNRLKERKYNHMELVAGKFAKLSGFPFNKKFLTRIKDTQKQFKLTKKERIQNIKNAFSIDTSELIDKNQYLLILDDITSTGITLEEIVKLLKNNGYKNIIALTLATPDIWN